MGAADTPTRAPSLTFAAAAPLLAARPGPLPQDFASHKEPQHNSAHCEYKLRCIQPTSALASWSHTLLLNTGGPLLHCWGKRVQGDHRAKASPQGCCGQTQ